MDIFTQLSDHLATILNYLYPFQSKTKNNPGFLDELFKVFISFTAIQLTKIYCAMYIDGLNTDNTHASEMQVGRW